MASTYRHTPQRIGGWHGGRIGSYTTGVVVNCRIFLTFLQQVLFVCGTMLNRVQQLRWRCHFEQFETRMKRFEKGNGNCSETYCVKCDFLCGVNILLGLENSSLHTVAFVLPMLPGDAHGEPTSPVKIYQKGIRIMNLERPQKISIPLRRSESLFVFFSGVRKKSLP
jgi:hypothetical protein